MATGASDSIRVSVRKPAMPARTLTVRVTDATPGISSSQTIRAVSGSLWAVTLCSRIASLPIRTPSTTSARSATGPERKSLPPRLSCIDVVTRLDLSHVRSTSPLPSAT